MKNETFQKITTLSVVIFSFVALMVFAVIWLVLSSVSSLLVLKTNLPESFLMIAEVITYGIALVIAAAFLVSKTKIKGIYGSGIIFALIVLIKICGNALLHLDGYLNLNGMIGILFTAIFSLVGGVVGGMIK